MHYPALAGIVEATCAAYGTPYRTQPTVRAAMAAHYRFLRTLGGGRVRPTPCGPVVKLADVATVMVVAASALFRQARWATLRHARRPCTRHT